ncbi:hypothetical protein F5B19DRAFT_500872 [Rostrohypoxylon terebratum]|nr:hypothetical protein F5B19DRAFT_500872 [Rostrohypoxylon terebratum]
MELQDGHIRDEAVSTAATLSWNTFLSRTSISSLGVAAFSDSDLSRQVHGLDDVLNTVKALSLPHFRYDEIERQAVVGEGVTFIVERCVVRGQVVAVKHLKNEVSQDDNTFRRRLQSVILELRIMRHAPLRSHPNIVPVFGYGWNMRATQIVPYLLVQYAPYGTLRQYLQHSKSAISITHKEILLGDVAAAISALHLCGIIHGDVKLDNVLVFHSWDRPAKSIAKIADFGHSLVISGKENSEQPPMRYRGTFMLVHPDHLLDSPISPEFFRYNAPEVHDQKDCPIDRSALHKCDVWAFGILIWETFLDGDEYVKHIPDLELSGTEDGKEPILAIPDKFLDLAKTSPPSHKSDLRVALIRAVFVMTIQVDPTKRVLISRNSHSCQNGSLKAELALHFGNSEWSYEMFRPENGREIPWEHEVQIFEGLRRTYSDSHNRNGDAAWQLALCHHIGFGNSPNAATAYQLALTAERLNHPVARIFAPLLALNGSSESYSTAKSYAGKVVELIQQNPTIAGELHFMGACCEGESHLIFSGLKEGEFFDVNTEDGCSILHLLFMLEDHPQRADVLDYLRSRKELLSLNQPTKVMRVAHVQWPLQLIGSPLTFAISVGSAKTVHDLISLGANPCLKAFAPGQFPESDHRSKWTPIHVAVQFHCHEILPDLLKIASDVGFGSEVPYACALSFSSSLERIAMHGNNRHDALEKTISILKGIQDLSASAPNGMTALMQAIDFQDTEVVSALIAVEHEVARRPFFNPSNRKVFNLPIHFASQLGARRDVPKGIEIMETIDQYSKDMISAITLDSAGRTTLHFAVTGPSKRAATSILEKKPDMLNIEDQYGRTALHYCYSATNVDLLLSYNININHTDVYGLTTLHLACFHGKLDIVRCLLEKKPLLNLKNNPYGTPLHCSIIQGSLEITVALLEAGALVNESDGMGNAPLHVAASFSRHSIIRLLVQHEADIRQQDANGRTAAMVAKSLGTLLGTTTLEILEGRVSLQEHESTEAHYTPYIVNGSDDEAIPVRDKETASMYSDATSRRSNVAIGSVELIDFVGANAEKDDFNTQAENESGSQVPNRKVAEFIYSLTAQYNISHHEARFIVRNFVYILEELKKKNLDNSELATDEDFENILFEEYSVLVLTASLLRICICVESNIDEDKVANIRDVADKKHGLITEVKWYSVGNSIAIALELGRPMWDTFELDDKKASQLVGIGKRVDQIRTTSLDVEGLFGFPLAENEKNSISVKPTLRGLWRYFPTKD